MMSLLYSNTKIIKAEDVIFKGKKTIKINMVNSNEEIEIPMNIEEELMKKEEAIALKVKEAEEKYDEIVKSAEEEGLKIIETSKNNALDIEKKAYEQGHSQGVQNGYEVIFRPSLYRLNGLRRFLYTEQASRVVSVKD